VKPPAGLIDLGAGIIARPYSYRPDRRFKANRGKPHIEWAGVIIEFPSGTQGSVMFDLPGLADAFPKNPKWTLVSTNPLHVEPSVQCYTYDAKTKTWLKAEHGHIRAGRWQPA
jgi:hypothetical protein